MTELRTAASQPLGMTLFETAIAIGCAFAALAVAVPLVAQVGFASGDARSLANLRAISMAHESYAAAFSNRQATWIPDDAGAVGGDCQAYLASIACPPPLVLGFTSGGGQVAYYLGESGLCASSGYPGSCASWSMYKPIDFAAAASPMAGAFRLPNAKALNAFVDNRFYSDVFYAPNDHAAYIDSSPMRDAGADWAYSEQGAYALSSYCLSPAAMYHPDVFGSGFGGYRDPASFDSAFVSPSATQCAYPELKTRTIEYRWLNHPPGRAGVAFADEAHGVFNASRVAAPLSNFFDGSVRRLQNGQAIDDDAALFKSSGQRLWSRTTPFGAAGYLADYRADDSEPTSHTILTLDGILGRDLLRAR